MIRAANQNIGLNTDRAQLFHRMLGGFGFGLTRGRNVRHQSKMHKHSALRAHFYFQLSDRFKKRLRLDITNGTADFYQRHIKTTGASHNATFDLISNMRDYLNGATEIVTPPFFANHILIDAPAGEVVALGHGSTNETLVVTQVKIRLGAIFRHKYFTVLEWAHGPGIDIYIRIQFQHCHLEATRLKNGRQRG